MWAVEILKMAVWEEQDLESILGKKFFSKILGRKLKLSRADFTAVKIRGGLS